MTRARPYGDIIRAASEMAAQGATASEIRAALAPRYGYQSVGQAISRLRRRGELPERVLRQPTVVHIDVGQYAAARLRELAHDAGVPRATIARRALLRGLRETAEIAP